MNYLQLRQQIANRLDQRSDLDQIIQDFFLDRISYWSQIFFYSSKVTDTSLTTSVGTYIYNLPNNIRNVAMIRLLIPGNAQQNTTLTSAITLPQATIAVASTINFTTNGSLNIDGQIVSYTGVSGNNFTGCAGGTGTIGVGANVTQVSPSTTTTADVTLPATSIPVASTAGFLPNGLITLGGTQVSYTSLDATNFLGCVGGAAGTVLSGALVQQIYGIWYPLVQKPYEWILLKDPLAPPNQALPGYWAYFGTQFRLFPSPAAQYAIEITGNAGPAAPVADADSNFWTTDASSLMINDTTAEIYAGYLHNPQREAMYRPLAGREKGKLTKLSWNLRKKVIRGYL